MKNQRCIFDRALRVTGFVKSDFGSPEILVQPLAWSCISICRESKTRLLILETGTRSFSSVNKPKAPSLLAMARDAIKGYVCGEIPLLPSITPSPCPYSIPFHPWPSYRLITIGFAHSTWRQHFVRLLRILVVQTNLLSTLCIP